MKQIAVFMFCMSLLGISQVYGNEEKIITLGEVKVSAQGVTGASTGSKIAVPMRDVPASIQVIEQDVIKTQNASADLNQAIHNVSGMTQSSSSNYGFFNNYQIRGLNMNFLRDGIPDGSTVNGYARSLVDVERVEVLKGPGSALYGSGAPGGSVNLISKAPEDTAAYAFSQTAGSFGTYQTTADITGPFLGGQTLLYRMNASYYSTDGFRDLGRETSEIMPTFVWKVTEGHEVTIDLDYREIEVTADTLGIPFRGASRTSDNPLLGVERDLKYYTPFGNTEQQVMRLALSDSWEVNDRLTLRNNFVLLDRDLYLLRNSGGAVAVNGSSMTGRSLREQQDDVIDYLYQFEPVFEFNTWGLEHTLLTGFETQYHDWNATRNVASLPNINDVFNPVIPETSLSALTFVPNFDLDIQALYLSSYVQDQIKINEQLKIRVGGRWDRFDAESFNSVNKQDQDRTDDVFSGQAGVVFQPWENSSFYGGVASGKFSSLSTESSTLDIPESSLQYEVGNKSTFFDDRLSVNVALFDVTREDFSVTIGTERLAVGEQNTRGAELDVTIKPVDGWSVTGNYAYQDAKLVSVPQTSGLPSVENNAATGIPLQSASLWSTYEFQEGTFKGFGFGGGAVYKAKTYVNMNNTQTIPDYVLGNLVFFYKRDWWELQLNVSNIGDVTYYRNGVNSGALPGDPAAVSGTFRAKF